MIAIKEKDRVYLAYPLPFLTKLMCCDLSVETMKNRENLFFWKVKGTKNCIMMGDCTVRYNDVLRYDDKIITCKKVTYENVISKIRQNIYNKLKEHDGIDKEEDTMKNVYFIAQNKNVFKLNSSDITEIEEYECSGYFRTYIRAGMDKYKDLPVYEKLVNITKDCEAIKYELAFPLMVTDTKSMKVSLLDRDGTLTELYDL